MNCLINGQGEKLTGLKIDTVYISFSDSLVYYPKRDRHLSLRMYPWEKATGFYYDFADSARSLTREKGYLDTGDFKIAERTYFYKQKYPGIR